MQVTSKLTGLYQILSWSFQNAGGEDFSTEPPNYGRPHVVMSRPLYSAAVISSSFFFSPRPFSPVADWMSTIGPTSTDVAFVPIVRIQNAGLKCAARAR